MKKIAILWVVFILLLACGEKPTEPQYTNPFDPQNVNYDNVPPKIVLNLNTQKGITNETQFIFDASKSYENDDKSFVLFAKWDLDGDGKYDEEFKQNNLIKKKIFEIGGGEKILKLKIMGAKGLTADTTFKIFVNTRPQAQFTASRDNDNYCFYHFDASASSDYEDGSNLQYRWDFDGDGTWDTNWLTQKTIDHEYAGDGSYTVKLSVRDQNQLSGEKETQIKVKSFVETIYVSGGSFTMGDTWGDGDSDERPTHTVTVNSFYMGKYEVTNAQVVEVFNWALAQGKITASSSTVKNAEGDQQELLELDDSDCQISFNGSQLYVENNYDNYPVIEISWYGAAAFCNYLSEREGLTPVYDLSNWTANWNADGYRLPTEAEWEYAARGGNQSQGYKYSGSDNVGEVAWYYDNSGGHTHEVGTKQPNELGIFDMSGNVWEWCWDWYSSGYYSSSPQDNPKGPDSGSYRVVRGGSWYSIARNVRVASRGYNYPSGRYSNVGFRLLRTK